MFGAIIKNIYCLTFFCMITTCVVQKIDFPDKTKLNSAGIEEKPIVVVICSYNNAQWYVKNLDSVFSQQYENFAVIYLDDVSSDGTAQLVNQYLEDNQLHHKCMLIKNVKHTFKMANLYKAFHLCPDEAIIVELDGDDWLPHEHIFSLINTTYSAQDIWMTYGHFVTWPANVTTYSLPHVIKTKIAPAMIARNTFRKINGCIWAGLRTYYAWLAKTIKLQDVLYKNTWLTRTSDTAIMLPMFEMAGHHHAFINDILLVHNQATTLNDHKVDPKTQYALELFIRRLPPYQRLLKKPTYAQKDLYHVATVFVESEEYQIGPEGKQFREQLLEMLMAMPEEFVMLTKNTQDATSPYLQQALMILEKTRARGLFLQVDQNLLKSHSFGLSDHISAWQFGFVDQKIITQELVLNAIYKKTELINIISANKKIFSWQEIAQSIIKNIKPLEVGLFFHENQLNNCLPFAKFAIDHE